MLDKLLHASIRTRFAPSPTGYMHLGNVWIAFLNWLWTRQQKGEIVLRIEDIDRQRCKEEYIQGIEEDLAWLGLDYDEAPGNIYDYGEPLQSHRFSLYHTICEKWKEKGDIYPCYCSRARLHSISSAPHEGEALPVYDGHCRHLTKEEQEAMTKAPSWRIKMEPSEETFTDLFSGTHTMDLEAETDDFLIRRADGMVAYQLAVSIDDGAMGITHVFRGNDLLSSTFYQTYLLKKLGYPVPTYAHLPLLVDAAGVRLSKRQHGITIRELKEAGKTPGDIIGLLLYYAGALPKPMTVTSEEALRNISFDQLRHLSEKHIEVVL